MSDTIWVIEDDSDLREGITEILQDNGFDVRSFDSAEAAQQEFQSGLPALAIVDNMMPGMGGMAFISILKKTHPQVKIVMITAFSTIENAVTAMKSGADDYLAKPFKRNDLLVTVRRSLEELKFEKQIPSPGMDEALACLSNPIRRDILNTLFNKGGMKFMDITRHLKISDHTKVNFHLKNLKTNSLVYHDRERLYNLTPQGKKMVHYIALLSKQIH